MQRVLNAHIRASIDQSLLSTSQHTYTRCKSVEIALHSLISRVEKSLHELLLSSRIVSFTLVATHCQGIVCRGTLQGGVLSPLLWNLAVNLFMRRLDSSANNVVAYADDIAIAASRICTQTLSDRLNLVLSIALDWRGDFVLSINPSKTAAILFTRKYTFPTSLSLV